MTFDKTKKFKLINKVGFSKYFKASSWPEYNKHFFDNLAKKYDATTVMHSFGTKTKMDENVVAKIPFPKNAKVLDVCAGTCDVTIQIAKTAPDADITAFDASEKMLECGRKKVEALNLQNVHYQIGDALKLPFKDEVFDVAIISYGLRNLEDLQKGLSEMKRVVKKGGWIINVDQGKPTNPLFKIIYKVYFYHIAPLLGKLVFHLGEFNSFRYLPESNRYFPDQNELMEIFKEIGLTDVKNYNYWQGAVAQQMGKK